jgi:hypothetical protein
MDWQNAKWINVVSTILLDSNMGAELDSIFHFRVGELEVHNRRNTALLFPRGELGCHLAIRH